MNLLAVGCLQPRIRGVGGGMPPAGINDEEKPLEDKKKFEPDGYAVEGPIAPNDMKRTRLLFAKTGGDAEGHYESALFDETLLMYHLTDRETGAPVGFMSIKRILEPLGECQPANAYFAVEYVYVAQAYRGAGLGELLRQTAAAAALVWLEEQLQQCRSGIRCMSSSHPVSSRGLSFSRRLDFDLQQWCQRNEVGFMTSTIAT
jgi:GNAT superfamily N-acetyltransferase